MVKVNGQMMDIAGKTVKEYLISQKFDISRVAVEKNGEIVPKTEYDTIIFSNGDSVEVVSFVGGG